MFNKNYFHIKSQFFMNQKQILVLRPAEIVDFSIAAVFRIKAQCVGNGCSLLKYCNAVAGCHGDALWIILFMPMDCVDPLDKGATIVGEAHLAMNDVPFLVE